VKLIQPFAVALLPFILPSLANAQNPVITFDATTSYGTIAHGAVGANHLWMDGGDGTVNTSTLAFKPGYVEAMNQMSLGSLRWPCGTRANLFRWKRAIGPAASRTKIPLGEDDSGFGSKVCYFGPDECGKLREATGMDISVLVNCATGDANEAADLVEYMNAPLGTNPRGGIAWAEVRAANGHPEPYGIKYWEIGNEYYLASQNYWLDPLWGNRTAYAQAYALGGSTVWVTNGVVKEADFSPSAMLGDGTANQVRFARYPPVDSTKPFTLYVSGVAWACVTNLAAYGGSSQVYTLDFPTGTIRFGDGMHGARPASGAEIRLSYTCGRHDGFVDYDREMKAVDPTIKVYSCLDWSEFCAAMGTNHPYDGLVKHMYPSYGTPIAVADSEAAWRHRVTSAQFWFFDKILPDFALLAQRAGGRARGMDVVVTEFGLPDLAITSPDPAEVLQGHPLRDAFWYALFMQASSAYGVPLCMKHMLLSNNGASDESKHFLFHTSSTFALGAIGHATAQVARLKDKQLLACWTANNPVAASYTTFGSRQALQVTAARDTNGALWLLVINIDRTNHLTATVKPLGFINTGSASAWTLTATADWSNNWDSHTNDVNTTFQTLSVSTGSFAYTFPKHSITVLQLPQARINGGWQAIREYAFTNTSTASNIWFPADLEWWLAGKAAAVSVTNLDPAAGYALRLVGEDPSHGRATLTFPASYTSGRLRLSADVWVAGARNDPLWISFGDNNRAPLAGVGLSNNRDGLLTFLNSSGSWQATQSPYYQDNWLKLDIILDLDARKYDVLINGFKLFVGGEGRDIVAGLSNPINKVTFETSGTSGDAGTFYIDNVTVSRFVTNTAPVAAAISNRTITAGRVLVITNTATDPEAPPQTLTWTLQSGPPNATLDATGGVFLWRPTIAQSPCETNFQVKVEDNGLPALSATQSFQVTVTAPARPRFISGSTSGEGQFLMQITGDAGPDYNLYASTNLRHWDLLGTTSPAVLPFQFAAFVSNAPQRFFQVRLGP
jgi:alpha-N-arabinofuranosidase